MSHRRHPDSARSNDGRRRLEVVAKADTRGTLEALVSEVARLAASGVPVSVIGASVGDVSKTDVDLAATGSRLVVGFGVGGLHRVEELARQRGVEVRLYAVLDHLVRDLGEVGHALEPAPEQERILGSARVVALFKGSRHGVILGCRVEEGVIGLGARFRIISAPGVIYAGRVESLRIEQSAVRRAVAGQQVGVKISDFKGARVGDLMECFEDVRATSKPWVPRGGVVRVDG